MDAARGGKVQSVQLPLRRRLLRGHRRRRHRRRLRLHAHAQARPAEEGETVKTGQQIGVNDDTGNASGCHLHFEMWSAPGWYEGGEVIDPLPS